MRVSGGRGKGVGVREGGKERERVGGGREGEREGQKKREEWKGR